MEEREGVDDSLINFSPILNDVLLDKFVQPLPQSLACFSPKKRRQGEEGEGFGSKKPRTNEDESMKVLNDDRVAEWSLREGEDYSIFAGKHQESKPKIRGRFACSRWFIKGYCLKSCKNKIAHLTEEEIPMETRSQMSTWVKMCRGE